MDEITDIKKKILITAKNSYIGNAFAGWVADDLRYSVDFISCRTDHWKQSSFTKYDVVLHVAGIAHVDAKGDLESLYYKVNRDLTINLAEKAKADGVKQFIFMSSMIVFGESNALNQSLVISRQTKPNPSSFYGNSKLQAEQGLSALKDEIFNIAIVRPPMVYGIDSKGNFPRLIKLAKKLPIFPNIANKRSMLYIDNLCEFIRLVIDKEDQGYFHPQNKEYVTTSEMVRTIGTVHGKKILLVKLFNPLIYLMSKRVNTINKLFGTFIYEQEMSEYCEEYCVKQFDESIRLTERYIQ